MRGVQEMKMLGWIFLAAFISVTCVVNSNAVAGTEVVAWGAGKTINTGSLNDYGQSIVPANLTNAVMLAAGWRHSLALKADGRLLGWGDDTFGQTDFPAGTNYESIACGELHSVALANGSVVSVGDDGYGQTQVPAAATNVVAIACGFYHSLALRTDGTVIAWGGQGDGYSDGHGTVPAGLSNVVAIAAGGYHNLVLKSNGTLFAWGDNTYNEASIPPGLSNVVAIAAGDFYNTVLKSDGTLFAWGYSEDDETNVPAGLSNVVAVVSNSSHSLALRNDGTVVAWGLNTEGDTNVPANLTNVTQIAAGDTHCLALVANGPPPSQTLVRPFWGTNGFSLSVPTQNGRTYQLEYKNSLTDAWHFLQLRAGTGGNVTLTDSDSANQRFYRVLRW